MGRSSGTSAELIPGLGRSTKVQKSDGNKPESSIRGDRSNGKTARQRGQPDSVQDTHRSTLSESLPKLSALAQAKPTSTSQQLRRGRSSNTAAEIRGVANAFAQAGDKSRTRGRSVPARQENAAAPPVAVQEGSRKHSQNAPATTDILAGSAVAIEASPKSRKSTRISNASQASESANRPTPDSEMGKKRNSGNAPAEPSTLNQMDRGRKRTRQADPQIQAKVLPATLPQEDERGGKRTRLNAVANQPVKCPSRPSKKVASIQESHVEVQVEFASSKLTKSEGKRKQKVSSSKASGANTAKSSSAAEASVKVPKPRRIQSSSRPETQKKAPRLSQPEGRKRRNVNES